MLPEDLNPLWVGHSTCPPASGSDRPLLASAVTRPHGIFTYKNQKILKKTKAIVFQDLSFQ